MPYRLEVSANARAGCNGGKPCKGTKIGKGELRFGTWTKIKEFESWKWRHWGCMTKKVFTNLKNECATPDDIDGYDEIPEAYQDKVRAAWDAGEVDPEDIPESAKKPPEEDDGAEEDPDSPKKKPKKASKKEVKSEDDNGVEEWKGEPDSDEKPKKKRKAKKSAEEEAVSSEAEVIPKKKARGRKAKAEDE